MISRYFINKILILVGDAVLILLASYLATMLRLGRFIDVLSYYTGATTFTVITYLTVLYIFDLYSMDRASQSANNVSLKLLSAVLIAGFVSGFLFYSLPNWKYGRGIFLIQMALVFVFLRFWRLLILQFDPISSKQEYVLIIGAGDCGAAVYDLLKDPFLPYRVVGFLDDNPAKRGEEIGSPKVLGTTDQIIEISAQKEITTAILAITHERSPRLVNDILQARLKGIDVIEMPSFFEKITGRVPVEHVHDGWLVFTNGFNMITKSYIQKLKRLTDLAVSGLLLLLTLPFMAVVALAIRLESPGPIFFKQERVGKGGKIFTLWKFRSMRQNSEENGAEWAQKKDPRVTHVGRFIRYFRIDELPQIWNIFKGEMSLIGPRPERPEFVSELEVQIPYYSIRHSVRPGLTGWGQINYPYGASIDDARRKLEYEVYYIKNMSLLLDLKILLRTISVVLFGEGAR